MSRQVSSISNRDHSIGDESLDLIITEIYKGLPNLQEFILQLRSSNRHAPNMLSENDKLTPMGLKAFGSTFGKFDQLKKVSLGFRE